MAYARCLPRKHQPPSDGAPEARYATRQPRAMRRRRHVFVRFAYERLSSIQRRAAARLRSRAIHIADIRDKPR